jgi:hypothetical protein
LDLIREFTGRDGMRMTWWVYEDTLHRRIPFLIRVRLGTIDKRAIAAVDAPLTLNRG